MVSLIGLCGVPKADRAYNNNCMVPLPVFIGISPTTRGLVLHLLEHGTIIVGKSFFAPYHKKT
eukprot:1083313-Rhodomonas_salina.3